MNFEIKIEPSGVVFQSSPDNNLLDSAISNDIFLDYSCKKGDCGLCTATILSGSVKTEDGQVFNSGPILTCCSYSQSDLVLQATYIPELSGVKCVTLPCKVKSLVYNTDDIVTLILRLPPSMAFHYLEGQYIDLIFNGVRRSYSIANSKKSGENIELHIRLLADGEFSNLLKTSCSVDQLMRIEGPKGTFFIRKSTAPILFIAGGTGFAPIKAMIEDLLFNKVDRTIYIYWGMRDSKSFYTEIASQWAEKYPHIHFVPVLSDANATWDGRRGFVHQAVYDDFVDLSSFHVYACGSSLMVNSAKEAFLARGLNADHFFADIFLSSN